ncbi:hypothetical protein ACLOJK_030097 [Asimina triloba]
MRRDAKRKQSVLESNLIAASLLNQGSRAKGIASPGPYGELGHQLQEAQLQELDSEGGTAGRAGARLRRIRMSGLGTGGGERRPGRRPRGICSWQATPDRSGDVDAVC